MYILHYIYIVWIIQRMLDTYVKTRQVVGHVFEISEYLPHTSNNHLNHEYNELLRSIVSNIVRIKIPFDLKILRYSDQQRNKEQNECIIIRVHRRWCDFTLTNIGICRFGVSQVHFCVCTCTRLPRPMNGITPRLHICMHTHIMYMWFKNQLSYYFFTHFLSLSLDSPLVFFPYIHVFTSLYNVSYHIVIIKPYFF